MPISLLYHQKLYGILDKTEPNFMHMFWIKLESPTCIWEHYFTARGHNNIDFCAIFINVSSKTACEILHKTAPNFIHMILLWLEVSTWTRKILRRKRRYTNDICSFILFFIFFCIIKKYMKIWIKSKLISFECFGNGQQIQVEFDDIHTVAGVVVVFFCVSFSFLYLRKVYEFIHRV